MGFQLIYDAHAHLVCADQNAYPPAPLRGELSPGEFDDPMTVEKLVATLAAQGVVGACAVQRAHVYGYDNSYMLDCADRFPDLLDAVVVLDPLDHATGETLRTLVRERGIAGVRFGSRDLGSGAPDWLAAPAAASAWRAATDLGLPICVHVLHVQRDIVLPALAARLSDFPDAVVVVDHVGGAHAAKVEQGWLAQQGRTAGEEFPAMLLQLVDRANAVMKISDINLAGSPDPAGFVGKLVSHFGSGRLIWGSDIGQSRGDFGAKVGAAKAAVAGLGPETRQAILHDNAVQLYRSRPG
jgi:L-fuconolactonase